MKKERQTRQLRAVRDVVKTAHDHPSADEVHRRARHLLPSVSLGTVYRNLQKLATQEQVRVVQFADRSAAYDGMCEDHDHFVCEHCGAISDLLGDRQVEPDAEGLRRAGFEVRYHTLTFYGLCPGCRGRPRMQRGRKGSQFAPKQV